MIAGLSVNRVNDDADLLDVRFKGPNPEDCGDIVNAVLRSYQQYLKRQFQSSNSQTINLLTQAKVDLSEQLEQAEKDYAAFRARAELIFEGDAATNLHMTGIHRSNEKLAELEVHQRTIQAKKDEIDAALQKGGSREAMRLMLDQTSSNETGEVARNNVMSIPRQLLPLTIELETLLLSHGPAHPDVLKLKKKIEVTERTLLQEQGIQQQGSTGQRVDYLQIYLDSLDLELATAQAETEKLSQLLKEQTAASKALSAAELENTTHKKKIARLRISSRLC